MIPTTVKTPQLGEIVAGRYRVEGQLGQGGFGAVFVAVQINLGRRVALKVLLPELVAQQEGMIRFRREAELAQRLEHPNTVRVLDFGQDPMVGPFIVFELLHGQPLDDLLRTTRGMPPARVARIASQVLKSLMEAHARGIVHRDIKPSNIILCDFPGEPDFVKVLDFGIAKPLSQGQTAALTRQGTAIGTPAYMAPEQVAGAPVTPAADLYSLGLVMAEALTGEPVFRADSVIQICMEQLSPAPVPLAPQVLQSPLGVVIRRATEKQIERRYTSAGEMLEQLDVALRQPASDPGRSSLPQRGSYAYAPTLAATAPAPTAPAFTPPGYDPSPHAARAVAAQPPGMPPAYGGPMAPPMQPPIAAQPAGGGTSGGIIALVVGGAILLFVLFACSAIFLLAGSGASPKSSPTAQNPRSGGQPVGKGNLRDLSPAQLRDKVQAVGFKVIGETVSNQQTLTLTQLTVSKSPQGGSVMLYRFEEATTAQMTADSLRNNPNTAIARDGSILLVVIVAPSGSRELLDAIVR